MHLTVYLTVKLHRSFNCNFTSIYNSVHNFKFMLLFVPVQDVELAVQDVESKGNPINLTKFFY